MDWNQRYASDAENWLNPTRTLLIEHADLLAHSGLAFEAAMGMGNNLPFLLEHGYRVIGVERSEVAAKYVHDHFPSVSVVLADLAAFRMPTATFDLICNFYFLEMALWGQFQNALKPGGILIIETLLDKMLEFKPDIKPDRLLRSGTLPGLFPGMDILYHREGWVASDHGNKKAIASLIARNPI